MQVIICIFRPIFGIIALGKDLVNRIPLPELSWENFMKASIAQGQHNFFLSNPPALNATDFKALKVSPFNCFIGIADIVMTYFHHLGSMYSGIFTLTGVCVLWTATNDFYNIWVTNINASVTLPINFDQSGATTDISDAALCNLNRTRRSEQERQSNFAKFLKEYVALKKLAAGINELFGELYLYFPIALCFYYATELNILFGAAGWIRKLYFSYVLIQNGLMLILSGDVSRKVW